MKNLTAILAVVLLLAAPLSAHDPIKILKIGFGWGSVFGGAPDYLERALKILGNGQPNPGTPQFSLGGPVLRRSTTATAPRAAATQSMRSRAGCISPSSTWSRRALRASLSPPDSP